MLALVALLSPGCGSDPSPTLTSPITFRMTASLAGSSEPSGVAPFEATTWLTLTPSDPNTGTATLSAYGRSLAGGYTLYGKQLEVFFDAAPWSSVLYVDTPQCFQTGVLYASVVVRAELGAGGALDHLVGEAKGQWVRVSGDQIDTVLVEGAIEGVPDMARIAAGRATDVGVVGPFSVYAHAPALDPRPSLDLLSADGAVLEAGACTTTPTGWTCTPSHPLAWGTAYGISAPDGFAPGTFTTVAAPALFDTPDFEGTVHGAFSDDARLITGSASLPTEGAQALVLRPTSDFALGGTFTARLDATGDALVVRFRETDQRAGEEGFAVPIIVFDATTEHVLELAAPDASAFTEDVYFGKATPVLEQTIPLPEGLVGPIGVHIALSDSGVVCGWLPGPSRSVQIESLAIE